MQHKQSSSCKLIGLMSGTSLDGLDICYAQFNRSGEKWEYSILLSKAVAYPDSLLLKLKNAMTASGLELFMLDRDLGVFYGNAVNDFIKENNLNASEIDAIASHGQTIFHQPDKGLTVQIGCGESIAVITGIKTINDFRKRDVLHGGQGAPLVPIGDKLLFSEKAEAFLNIGGFANFSKINTDDTVTAYDICPANSVINYFTRQLGFEYDKDGEIASKSSIDEQLLKRLNDLDIYKQEQPPSLGWEFVERGVLPVFNAYSNSLETNIATATEHAAFQIAKRLNENGCHSVFITGGGAKNTFLIQRLTHYFDGEIVIPSEQTIDFKEALIFAFLGALFLENTPNCLPSVTGARKAVVGGVVHRQ